MQQLAVSGWGWTISGVLCGLGTLTAVVYLVMSRQGRSREGIWEMESDGAFRQRMRRRRLGAALLGAVSIAFLVGLLAWEPKRWPEGYVLYWLIVMVMLAWLVGLGLADLIQTRRMLQKRGRRNDDARF